MKKSSALINIPSYSHLAAVQSRQKLSAFPSPTCLSSSRWSQRPLEQQDQGAAPLCSECHRSQRAITHVWFQPAFVRANRSRHSLRRSPGRALDVIPADGFHRRMLDWCRSRHVRRGSALLATANTLPSAVQRVTHRESEGSTHGPLIGRGCPVLPRGIRIVNQRTPSRFSSTQPSSLPHAALARPPCGAWRQAVGRAGSACCSRSAPAPGSDATVRMTCEPPRSASASA